MFFLSPALAQADEDFWNHIHPVYHLDWPNINEKLDYKSCGCAGNCWVAKLWDVSTNKPMLKAQLRCDCEVAFAILPGSKTEIKYADSCESLTGEDKNSGIIYEMENIIQ